MFSEVEISEICFLPLSALEQTLPVRGLQLSPQPGRTQLRRARKLHRDTPSHMMGRAVGAASNFLPRGAHGENSLLSHCMCVFPSYCRAVAVSGAGLWRPVGVLCASVYPPPAPPIHMLAS